MDNFNFYKNKYERELNRRNYLDGAINNPIIGITVVVSLNSYIISQYIFKENLSSIVVISFLILTFIISFVAVIFVFISVNNLFKGYNYENFGLLKDFRKFELDLELHNKNISEDNDRRSFEQNTVEKFIQFADNHTIINDKRGLYLYRSRSLIISAVLLTFINLSFVTINNFKMADDKPVNVPAPSPKPEPPRMPTDRIEKGETPSIPTQIK